jgi:hypothetical protein
MIRPFNVAAAVAILVAIGVVGGCSSEVRQPSGTRSPTDPRDVAIYPKAPKKYEDLGMVEVPIGGDVRWDARGDATPGFEKLKAAAAAKGANGILLVGPSPDMPRVLAGYKGTFYQVPLREANPRSVVVKAIYVIEP